MVLRPMKAYMWVELKTKEGANIWYKERLEFSGSLSRRHPGTALLQPHPGSNWVIYFMQKSNQKAVNSGAPETVDDGGVVPSWK